MRVCRYCLNNSLDPSKVDGRIVVCNHAQDVSESKLAKSRVVKAAGGVGMVLISELDKAMGVNFVIPGAIVGSKAGTTVLSYMNSTRYLIVYQLQCACSLDSLSSVNAANIGVNIHPLTSSCKFLW